MIHRKMHPQSGFTVVEGAILVIVIAVVAGAVFFVHNKNQKTAADDAATTAAVAATTAKATTDANKVGTPSGVDQDNDQETQDAAAINSKYESNEQTNAASTNASASDIGGAYNESNF